MTVPIQTRDLLKRIASGMPKTPYAGCKAISDYLEKHYQYGCSENILQEKYVRFPHEIIKSMNCNDAGIFNFLLTRQLGLDSILARFENFRSTQQAHFGVIIRGNSGNYLLENGILSRVRLEKQNIVNINDNSKESFESVELWDIPDLIYYRKHSNNFADFLEAGQTAEASYWHFNYEHFKNIPYEIQSFFTVSGKTLHLMRSIGVIGGYINTVLRENSVDIFLSGGVDNSILVNPQNLGKFENEEYKFRRFRQDQKDKYIRTYLRIITCPSLLELAGVKKRVSEHSKKYPFLPIEKSQIYVVSLFLKEIGNKHFHKIYNKHLPQYKRPAGVYFVRLMNQISEAQKDNPNYGYNLRVLSKLERIAKKEGLRLPYMFNRKKEKKKN